MYLGAYTRALTDGRIALPDEILAVCKGRKLFLTIAPGPCVVCLEESRWAKLEEKIMRVPNQNLAARKIQRFLVGSCFETTCSDEGNLEIPPYLATYSKIGDELLIIGLVNRFEIWDKKIHENRSASANETFVPEELVSAYGDGAKRMMEQIRKSYSTTVNENGAGNTPQTKNLFLCHSSKDKKFVRRLAEDLTIKGVTVWFDEWEMLPGDSLYEKIQKGIVDSSWFAIILSPHSIESNWCKRELHNALEEEFKRKRIYVIPILYQQCDIPGFLKEKVYVNMVGESYEKEFEYLLRRFDVGS